MSFDKDNQWNQNTQNRDFTNDSNNFGAGSRRGDNTWNDINFSDQGQQGQQQYGSQGFDRSQGYGGSQGYPGNTTDANVPGAGGDFGGTGRDAGRQRDVRDPSWNRDSAGTGAGQNWSGDNAGRQDWDRGNTGGDRWSGNQSAGAGGDNTWDDPNAHAGGTQEPLGKASMGDRLKGNMEKIAGRVTGDKSKVERGQERKRGEFDNDY